MHHPLDMDSKVCA